FARLLLAHDCERVGGGGSRVDDERLAGRARCADVRAKSRALPFEIAGQAVIIETGLADRDDFRLARLCDEQLDGGLRLIGVIRMDAVDGKEIVSGERDLMVARSRVILDTVAMSRLERVCTQRIT